MNIHVSVGNLNGDYDVVMHFPTPVGDNPAGIPWATAIVNSQLAQKSNGRFSVLAQGNGQNGTISAAEEAELAAGAKFEVVESFRPDSGPANPQQQLQALLAFYAERLATRTAQLQVRLKYFGFTHD